MIEVIFRALEAGLSLWEHKEKHKYIDKMIKLKKEWYHAYNAIERDNATLDNIEFELRVLVEAFSSKIGDENA